MKQLGAESVSSERLRTMGYLISNFVVSVIPASEIGRRVQIHVTVSGARWWNLRMTVTLWLLRLASVVAPVGFHVEVNE